MNKTKIIATLGPGTQSEARINLSHGERANHPHFIELVKKARRVAGAYSALISYGSVSSR